MEKERQVQELKMMEEKLLQTKDENKALEERIKILSMEVANSHKTITAREKQLENIQAQMHVIKEGTIARYLVQSLQDIATNSKGKITLEILDAQGWIDKIRNELEDKAESYTQALINEIVVDHFQDTMEDEEENKEEDDDDEEPNEGTSGQDLGSDDDDDDDQDDPSSGPGPSSGGAATEPSQPSDSQPEPPPSTLEGGSQMSRARESKCRLWRNTRCSWARACHTARQCIHTGKQGFDYSSQRKGYLQ
ncbi:hypothetical protein L7F22_036826 [Adiantum nelumboides]|nr:hypothetical protein [Adiantum nelumboides]